MRAKSVLKCSEKTSLKSCISTTLDATRPDPAKNQGGIAIVQLAVENHPQDSRVKINEDGVVQTLSGQMGTGGGNVPLILENK